jgi:hypothetical protein
MVNCAGKLIKTFGDSFEAAPRSIISQRNPCQNIHTIPIFLDTIDIDWYEV